VQAVAPWGKDVEPRPIFAVSDNTGQVAKRLSEAAFAQFGRSSRLRLSVLPMVRTEQVVLEVVGRASKLSKALVVCTLASPELSACLERECLMQGVPCINVLESLLVLMEKYFETKRSIDIRAVDDRPRKAEGAGRTVLAVSDTTGATASTVARAALQQFPSADVASITVCSNVRALGEIDRIVKEAFVADSLIVFTFASPGMSRFMRQQCERCKVTYADVLQPVVMASEKYLDYPPVQVAGGLDYEEVEKGTLQIEKQAL